MSEREHEALQNRYRELASRFKWAYVYNKVLQKLGKILMETSFGTHTTDIEALYRSLKDLKAKFAQLDPEEMEDAIIRSEEHVDRLYRTLLTEDDKVSPSLLRILVHRTENFGEEALAELIRFYIFSAERAGWHSDRLDKIDLLMTRLSEGPRDEEEPAQLQDKGKLEELFKSFWDMVEDQTVTAAQLADNLREVEDLRTDADYVDSFDELIDSGLVEGYRKLKHGLSKVYLEPEVLLAVVDTNVAFKNKIQDLQKREEQRLVSECRFLIDLEDEASAQPDLHQELSLFRRQVERLEYELQHGTVRLRELNKIRQQADNLTSRLGEMTPGQEQPSPSEKVAATEPPAHPDPAPETPERAHHPTLEPEALQLREVFVAHPEATPEELVDTPAARAVGIHPREVEAFRRLTSEESGQRDKEGFILDAAALRLRLSKEIAGIPGDSKLAQEARGHCFQAEDFSRHLEHHIQVAVQIGDLAEARAIQNLRMRLLRELSELWLLVL